VAVDSQNNVYILERGGNALRVVDKGGKIRTVVGPGKSVFGDTGRSPLLNGPKHLCIDRDSNVIIADTENHLIRRFRPADGTIARIAGKGKAGAAGLGGEPLQAELAQPHGVYVDPEGMLYIADSSNNRVVKIQ
jgi:DNA-binding beta-propeller fold protein YncE